MPGYSRNPVVGVAPCKVCGRTDEWRMDKTGSAYLTCPSVNGGCGSRVVLGLGETEKIKRSFNHPKADETPIPKEPEIDRPKPNEPRTGGSSFEPLDVFSGWWK